MLDAVAPSQTVAYAYGNSSWTDLLTSYNGQNIAYDAIGNPTSYLGYTLKWNGRQLSSLSGNGVTASYKYDADGLRSYKKVGNTETTYQYVGDKLMYEKRGTTEFFYYYNSFGNLAGIKYYVNGTRYMVYALCNTRGDVEDLYWGSGNLACHYTYDSWGNVISVTDINGNEITNQNNIGLMNPIRYRGYYYDSEIGMYYLQSRYYNPQVGRFISADGEISNVGGNVLGYNLFVYCFNNPVNMDDSIGQWPKWVGKAVAVVAVAAVVVAAVAVTVSTFGAGSVAGVAAISAAVTLAARATEVFALQVKKSKKSSNSIARKTGGSNSTNSGGGTNIKKSNSQVAVDAVESLFDNGLKIIGITPFTKAGSIATNHVLSQQVSKMFEETTTLHSTLSATGGKIVPYAFAAYAWCQTTISIFSDDPEQRAEQRGYTLK